MAKALSAVASIQITTECMLMRSTSTLNLENGAASGAAARWRLYCCIAGHSSSAISSGTEKLESCTTCLPATSKRCSPSRLPQSILEHSTRTLQASTTSISCKDYNAGCTEAVLYV